MPATINLQPDLLDLVLYAGDGVDLRMVCVDGAGAPVDLNGAIDAQIRVKRLETESPIVTFSVNAADAIQGKVILSLTGEQTTLLSTHETAKEGKFNGVWDVQWTPSGDQPRTLVQGKVECLADVSR